MYLFIRALLCLALALRLAHGFKTFPAVKPKIIATTTTPTISPPSSSSSALKTRAHPELMSTTTLIALGDYAAEIEQATGSEIYGPIMKAGVFIFVSGFLSAFLAGFIISQSNSWEGLMEEFDEGKEAQLLNMDDVQPDSLAASVESSRDRAENTMPSASDRVSNEVDTAANDLDGLDL